MKSGTTKWAMLDKATSGYQGGAKRFGNAFDGDGGVQPFLALYDIFRSQHTYQLLVLSF
jgi:hypothetical protein